MFKKDNLRFGMLLGFIAPLLSLIVYYFVRFYPNTVKDVLVVIQGQKNLITTISVPCFMLNIVMFTFYINTHRDKTAKGIFAITVVFLITALLIKFLL